MFCFLSIRTVCWKCRCVAKRIRRMVGVQISVVGVSGRKWEPQDSYSWSLRICPTFIGNINYGSSCSRWSRYY